MSLSYGKSYIFLMIYKSDLQSGAVAAIKLQKPTPKMMQNNQKVVFIKVMARAQKTRPTKLAASCSDSAFPMLAPKVSSKAPSAGNLGFTFSGRLPLGECLLSALHSMPLEHCLA